MYGRDASDISEYGENKRTIYCRLGFKKEICCKHHTHFIDYAKRFEEVRSITLSGIGRRKV